MLLGGIWHGASWTFGEGAARLLTSMLLIDRSGKPLLSTYLLGSALLAVTGLVGTHWCMRDRELHAVAERTSPVLVGMAWGTMLFLIAITQGGSSAFIYFQF